MFAVTKEQLLDAYRLIKNQTVDVVNNCMITAKVEENCFWTREDIKSNNCLCEENIISVSKDNKNAEGKTVDGRFTIDQAVFEMLPDVHCVIHLSSRYCSVWAQSGSNLPPISYQQILEFGGEIVCTELPMHRDGSKWQQEIAGKVKEAIESREADQMRALFINKYEALVFGADLNEAIERAILLEEFAYQTYLVGVENAGEYTYLPYNLIEAVRQE